MRHTDHADRLRAELQASLVRTLAEQARRNELGVAVVRVAVLLGLSGIEAWILSGPSKLGEVAGPAASLTGAYLVVAVILWAWLRAGGWSAAVPWLLPLVDVWVMGLRMGIVFAVVPPEALAATHPFGIVVGLASLVAVSGALRLASLAVAWTTALGLVFYATFASWVGLTAFDASIHVILVLAMGVMGDRVTHVVARAVRNEVTRTTLSRLLSGSVVAAADADPLALLTEPRALDATVVVTDLRGFTAWAEHRPPIEVLDRLNEIQGRLARTVLDHGGTVDKFMGDGMLAVFGVFPPAPDHADRALDAVAAMQVAMRDFPDFKLGTGVQSGELVVGCIGTGLRLEFTVLGDTVNTASRLEAATKDHALAVLIGEGVRDRASRPLRQVAEVVLRGRQDAIQVFTLPG